MLVVAERLEHAAVAIEPRQAVIVARDPNRAALIFQHARDLHAGGAEVRQLAASSVPLVQTRFGSDPDVARTRTRQREDAVTPQRLRLVRVVTEMLEAAGRRVEHIDAGLARADPNAPARVEDNSAHGVARQ